MVQTARAKSVPLTSAPGSAACAQRPHFERLLDRRLQSVSTFVTSAGSDAGSAGHAGVGPGLAQGGAKVSSAGQSQRHEEMPQAVLFPANKPTSRADAAVLDRWITESFINYAQRISEGQGEEEDLIKTVEDLVPILSIGLHELVRQVTQHCLERGVVLEKIWKTYVELFERALNETRALLRRSKQKTARVEAELERTRSELAQLQEKNPEQIKKILSTFEAKFMRRQTELKEQLRTITKENQVLQEHLQQQQSTQSAWFPLFDKYKESRYKRLLSSARTQPVTGLSAEARMCADFKRILVAMPPEGQRHVGFFISSLLGLRGTSQATGTTVEALVERKQHNEWKIRELEVRLKELKARDEPL